MPRIEYTRMKLITDTTPALEYLHTRLLSASPSENRMTYSWVREQPTFTLPGPRSPPEVREEAEDVFSPAPPPSSPPTHRSHDRQRPKEPHLGKQKPIRPARRRSASQETSPPPHPSLAKATHNTSPPGPAAAILTISTSNSLITSLHRLPRARHHGRAAKDHVRSTSISATYVSSPGAP
jgi:hypothetical protein